MVRVKNIGGIELDNPLFILESYKSKNVVAKVFETLSNSKIVYESYKRNPTITLDSKEGGWISEDTLKNILMLSDDLDVTTTLTTTQDKEIKVRFKHEMAQGFVEYSELYEGSRFYKIKLYLEEC